MNILGGIAIYFICWWMTLFTVLPLGVRTQGEDGDIIPGTISSAPILPYMGRKMMLATLLAFVPWGIIFAVMNFDIVSFEDFSFIPDFSNK